MAFRYKLETLLRLQRSLEHQEENRLLICVARIAGLNAALQAWEDARRQRDAGVWQDFTQPNPACLLQFASLWEQTARAREKEIREQLRLAELARQEQWKVYRLARQKRETLESLREREATAYTAEYLRSMQRDLDEAHLLRLSYQNHR